jgi:hypothetical protein
MQLNYNKYITDQGVFNMRSEINKHTIINIISLCCFLSFNLEATVLDINKHDYFLLGSLAFSYKFIDLNPAQHSLNLDSNAGAGYMILDSIAIGASLPARLTFTPHRKGHIGLAVFATYFLPFRWHNVSSYAGLELTPTYSISEKLLKLSVALNTGLLVAITKTIALDIALNPKIYIPFNYQQRFSIEIPIGFLGLRVFL